MTPRPTAMRSLAILFSFIIPALTYSQNKRALIIAVGQYAPNSSIRPIASVTDVKYIKAALRKSGFKDQNIDTLINAKATREAILNGLTRLSKTAQKGDIVVIHFGCHGQQIRDQKTVELGKDEDDGYDEALLPYDAKAKYNPTGYRGEKHLRDDDLFPKLLAIRQKIGSGGSMLVLLDACHSGTATRAESFAVTRGMPDAFPDPENPMDSVINLSASETKQGFFEALYDSISNMVVISGSSPHQENKQLLVNKEDVGALSYSFYRSLSEMPAGSTYELLFEKIKANIQALIPDQVPMIEGNTNQLIFSGKYAAKEEKTFVRVGIKENSGTTDTFFIIQRGMLDNLVTGTRGKIYKAGTNQVYANAVISNAENFISIGIADKAMKRTELFEFKPSEESQGPLKAFVKLKFNNGDAFERQMAEQSRNFLKTISFLTIAERADFQLEFIPSMTGKAAILTDRNNDTIWTSDLINNTFAESNGNQLVSALKRMLRVKYLRTLPDGGDLEKWVSASIIPEKPSNLAAGIILEQGDLYYLKIQNKSNHNLYYTVLDIYPNNEVEVLYPYKGKEAADYLVESNGTITRKLKVSGNSPAGVEFLKIIVSKEPMDLRSVFEKTARRDQMCSFLSALDDLINDKEGAGATRGDISSIKAEEVGIITVRMTIKNN